MHLTDARLMSGLLVDESMTPCSSTHRIIIFSPGDCRGGDAEGIAAQSQRLFQGHSEVQLLPVILDLRWN